MRYFLVLEIESPRGARQIKGDTSVVLEGSDGLEEIDKFLGDKVCKLLTFVVVFYALVPSLVTIYGVMEILISFL